MIDIQMIMSMSICVSHTHNSVLPASQSLTWQWHHPEVPNSITHLHTCPPDVNCGLPIWICTSRRRRLAAHGAWELAARLPTRAQRSRPGRDYVCLQRWQSGGAKQVIGIDLGPFEMHSTHLGTFGTFDFDFLDFLGCRRPEA